MTPVLRPETMSPNRYSFTGYDGSHEKMGRRPKMMDLAFSDEQLREGGGPNNNKQTNRVCERFELK